MKLAALTLKAKIMISAVSAAVVAAAAVGAYLAFNQKEESYRVIKVFETSGENNTIARESARKSIFTKLVS